MTVININNYSQKELNYQSLINMYNVVHERNTSTYLTESELESKTVILEKIPDNFNDLLLSKSIVVLKANPETDYTLLQKKNLPNGSYKLFVVNNILVELEKEKCDSINGYLDICSKVYDIILFINMNLNKNAYNYTMADLNMRVSKHLPKSSSDYEINIFHLSEDFKHSNGMSINGSNKKQYIVKEKKIQTCYPSGKKGHDSFDNKMFAIFNESAYGLISENDLMF